MSQSNRMLSAGLSAVQCAAIQGIAVNGLVAAGTTQATALPLPGDICKFATVGAGSGAIIAPCNGADCGSVFNGGASALLLYPPVGGKINGLGTNAGYSIAAATPYCDWYCVDPLTYIASQSA